MAAMRAAAALLTLAHASAAPIDALWWNMSAAVKADHLTYADQVQPPHPTPPRERTVPRRSPGAPPAG